MRIRTKHWWKWYNRARKEMGCSPRHAERTAWAMLVSTLPKRNLRKMMGYDD